MPGSVPGTGLSGNLDRECPRSRESSCSSEERPGTSRKIFTYFIIMYYFIYKMSIYILYKIL